MCTSECQYALLDVKKALEALHIISCNDLFLAIIFFFC